MEEQKEKIMKEISDWSRPDIEDLHDTIGDFIDTIMEDENR